MKRKGIIKKVNLDLEYGFVKVFGMEDVFFTPHTTVMEGACLDALPPKTRVEVTVQETERGLLATHLRMVL